MTVGESVLELLCSKTHRHTDRQTDRHAGVLYDLDEDVSTIIITRKRFSEKPIVAFTNSTVFILNVDFYI